MCTVSFSVYQSDPRTLSQESSVTCDRVRFDRAQEHGFWPPTIRNYFYIVGESIDRFGKRRCQSTVNFRNQSFPIVHLNIHNF